MTAKVTASVTAPTIRQGAIGRSFTRGYGSGVPEAGDGGTFVQVGPAGTGTPVVAAGTVDILVVVAPVGATGPPGGGIIAPRGRGSSGSMSSSSATALSDLRNSTRALERPTPPRTEVLSDGAAPSDTLGA
jgi:hypothetical protein